MSNEYNEQELLLEFMEGMKRAASAAGGMAHYQANPGWLKVRDLLESVRTNGIALACKKPLSRQETMASLNGYKRITQGN